MVIAIDGPGGAGKSTVSRSLARRLDKAYLDTGAFYRAATLAVLRQGVDPEDEDEVVRVVADTTMEFTDGRMILDGKTVGPALRAPEVTAHVSTVAAHPRLRRLMVGRQQEWIERHHGDAVVEGRDIGAVVCPQAALKVFLTASTEVRAVRRAGDEEARGLDVGSVAADLERRDSKDSTRMVSPLKPADDAVVIDTTALSAREVVARILDLVDG